MIPRPHGVAASETPRAASRNFLEWASLRLTTGIPLLSRVAHLDPPLRTFALDYGRSCRVSRASRTPLLFPLLLFYYPVVVGDSPVSNLSFAFAFSRTLYRLSVVCVTIGHVCIVVCFLAGAIHVLR